MIPTATNILSNHHFLLKMPKNNILELIMALRNFALFVVEANNAAAKMELNELKQGDSFCFNKEVRFTTNSDGTHPTLYQVHPMCTFIIQECTIYALKITGFNLHGEVIDGWVNRCDAQRSTQSADGIFHYCDTNEEASAERRVVEELEKYFKSSKDEKERTREQIAATMHNVRNLECDFDVKCCICTFGNNCNLFYLIKKEKWWLDDNSYCCPSKSLDEYCEECEKKTLCEYCG